MRDIVDDERRRDRGVHSQPFGLTAARRHLLRCHSSTMSRIAVIVAHRICRLDDSVDESNRLVEGATRKAG